MVVLFSFIKFITLPAIVFELAYNYIFRAAKDIFYARPGTFVSYFRNTFTAGHKGADGFYLSPQQTIQGDLPVQL